MNPSSDIVIVKLSSLPEADSPKDWAEHMGFFNELNQSLA